MNGGEIVPIRSPPTHSNEAKPQRTCFTALCDNLTWGRPLVTCDDGELCPEALVERVRSFLMRAISTPHNLMQPERKSEAHKCPIPIAAIKDAAIEIL